MTPQPFRLRIADAAIADLHARLDMTRWPDQPAGLPWAHGADLAWMQRLATYWRHRFDWRAQEQRLNAFAQYTTPLHGIQLHYIHEAGQGPAPMPLLLSHGWPGSVFEFAELIPRLTDPARFGADPADAFTVVAPSLPGYGLSFRPGQPGFSVEQIADAFAALMTDVLGYGRFATQGGDWGASISARLGLVHPHKTVGVHLNLLPIARDPARLGSSPAAQRYREELQHWLREETGYSAIQGTRPHTLAFGLSDSPIGLTAWIAEKMRAWSDCDGDIESVFSLDEILANVSLYWFTGAIGSSFWPYYARQHAAQWPIPEGATVDVPMGYAEFPAEILHPPRELAERTFTDIRRWSAMPRGGHFAAMEQPELLAEEIRAFYRPLRGTA
ncbi:epoxide hydrolase family protein [Variovorax paradoxus]|uniref:epoxide hydrolase family protein n=1 Tax=Variovorax paradoxus TaxID=34073 RepID=UPI001933EA8B|nr:alpha/beta fold hydrolase [Variovorax paradoxus]